MKKQILTLILIALGLAAPVSPALAGPGADALGACLADNTTGKDRKDLARWVFAAMAAHPEIRSLSNINTKTMDEINRMMGIMVTKLIADNCAAQARLATKEGGTAFQTAFGVIGRLAMQELMANPQVNASISGFEQYLDKDRLNAAMGTK